MFPKDDCGHPANVTFSFASGARFIGELVESMLVNQDVQTIEVRKHGETLHGTEMQMLYTDQSPRRDGAKRALDFGFALVLLVLTSPLLALIGLVVKLTSRGPVLYRQTRTGKGGLPYTIFKIRTMVHDCESKTGARWASVGDPRITLVGRFLRHSHLDELPQLWNVLRGEMSLVGPRPERPEFVVKLERVLPDYQKRLQVLPGVTGLAQIQLPADTDLESVRRKLVYDLYYLERRTLWLDLRIILSTACKVLSIPFALLRPVLQIPSGNAVEDGSYVINYGERPVFMTPPQPFVS
jgi:lipopolysaccharide/colanic/teichoic acid biosynthesis glycosyltransferase